MHTSYMTSAAAHSPSTRHVCRPEGRIAYDVQGTGPVVVLVPGMGDLRAGYRYLTPHLVAAGYTVATMDLRGHGDSDTTFSTYGDVETAGDIEALIDELGGKAVIGGNSLAAGAAVILAADQPTKVSGLVLLGPFVRNPAASAFEAWMFRKAFSQTTRQTTHDPAEARLGDVTAPAIVIMGDSDPDFKDPAGEANWIGTALNAQVVLVPEAGHYPQSQRPDITTPAVLGFLATVAPRA